MKLVVDPTLIQQDLGAATVEPPRRYESADQPVLVSDKKHVVWILQEQAALLIVQHATFIKRFIPLQQEMPEENWRALLKGFDIDSRNGLARVLQCIAQTDSTALWFVARLSREQLFSYSFALFTTAVLGWTFLPRVEAWTA